ncbi:MAG: DUF1552 domain-containing protein [Verrucomicrobiales bacterium]|nr:DUF1552 domain-containing protein [Verrucomicrobiales bacterium]MBP9223783.1 DUF1552 domain-containing protein [Verrucomicrobiales bacterium]
MTSIFSPPMNSHTSRRRFLRGTGVALGLPWFESLSVFGAETAKQNVAPRRLAVCFTGNGVNPHHWGAKMGAEGMEFADSLRPLESLKRHISVFNGLWNPTTIEGDGGHYPKMNVLSGLKVKKTTTDVEVGTTMDQIIAAHTGRETPVPSVVLGTERPRYGTDSGFTSIYSAYISWSSPTTPSPKEIFPQQAFDQLFDDGSKRKRDISILDLVLEDAKGLRPRLSQRDGHKLDEYLTSVREIELRIEQAEKVSQAETGGQGWHPAITVPTIGRPQSGIPENSEDHLRLLFEILLLAFQMDRTRVATYMMNNDLSNMRFPSLDGISSGIHELSHHAGDEKRLAHYQKVNEFQVKLWAEFLGKMDATNEGERSLLENSMIVLTSSLMDGNAHDSRKLPVVLAGGGGGTIKGGRVHELGEDPNRKLCRLHLALMDRMGVRVDHFGDAENALDI